MFQQMILINMDKLYFLYDENGFFTTTNYFEVKPENGTEFLIAESFIKAKFNGSEWIESATSEEVAENNIKQALHNETQKYIQRTNDGVKAYAKISAEFRLAKLSGTIDDATHTYLENLLIPVRNEVLAGQWISAKQKLIVIGVEQIGEVLYNRLFEQLTEYIEINY
jgi:hypothetical protein